MKQRKKSFSTAYVLERILDSDNAFSEQDHLMKHSKMKMNLATYNYNSQDEEIVQVGVMVCFACINPL